MSFDFLPQNSETSRRSIGQEIVKRVRSTEWPDLWTLFNDLQEKDQRLILFYAICCHYTFVQDFIIEVYHKKWLNMDSDIAKEDIAYFMELKADQFFNSSLWILMCPSILFPRTRNLENPLKPVIIFILLVSPWVIIICDYNRMNLRNIKLWIN